MRIDSEGVITAIDNFKEFKKQAKEVEDESSKTEKSVSSLDGAFRALSPSALTAVAGITALVSSIKTLANTGSEIIEMSSHFEQTRKSLESLLQSADKGKALFEDLRKFSFETTFGVDELASASSQLINAGVATKDLQKQLKMLGDVAQGDKGKFAELTSVFAKVQLMGKAGAQTISQFNIRGVPLKKTLTEMGVTGTASAKQVTEALEKLTAEGGQFHNAMNNIIDTIEGKRGFIDDTLKEIKVNLGEVTGLTEAYKTSLDTMYEVYDKINNKLMEWNKNPVMQAIIRGAIVGAITAIGLAITTAVIPALIKTVAQLQIIATLKAMINPTGLLVGLGISAVVGLGVAVKTIADNEKTVNDELIEQIKLRQTLGEIPITATTEEKSDYLKTMEEQLKQYQQLQETSAQKYTSQIFEGYFDTLAQYEKLIKEAEDKLAGFEARGIKKGSIITQLNSNGRMERVDTRTPEQKELEKTEQDLRRLKTTYDDLKKSYGTNLYYKSLQKNIEGLTKEIELQKQLEESTKKLNDYSPYAKQEQEIKELQTQLQEIDKMYEQVGVKSKKLDKETGEYKYEYDLVINFDPSYKQQLEEVKKEIEKELSDAQIKLKLSKMTDWQKELQKAFGLDDKTASNLIGQGGAKWVEAGLENRANIKKIQEETFKQLGINQSGDNKSRLTTEIQEIMSIINNLTGEGKFGAVGKNGELDNTFVKLNNELDTLKKQFIEAGGTLDEWNVLVGNSAKDIKKLKLPEIIQDAFNNEITALQENVQKFKDMFGRDEKGNPVSTFNDKLKGLGDILENVGKTISLSFASSLVSASSDLSNFLEGFEKGGWIVGIINTLVGAVMNVCQSFDNFDKVMNPITNMMKQATPALQKIFNSAEAVVDDLAILGGIFNEIFNILYPIIQMTNDLLTNLFESIYEIFQILQPIIQILRIFFSIIRLLIMPIQLLHKAINALINFIASIPAIGKALRNAGDEIEKWVDDFYKKAYDDLDKWSGLDEIKQQVADNEKKRMQDLTNAYTNLLNAMKENEDWYIRKKTELNANTRKGDFQSVNDMILTPQGQFSTHPDDYIIATKNPQGLGGAVVNVNIENNVSDVDVTATPINRNGIQEIMIQISRKIADDVANGANGWDSALSRQAVRTAGRQISF